MSDDTLLKEIRARQKEAIDVLYSTYREKFIRVMAARYTRDVAWATNIYQVVISIVYENIMSEKLTTLHHDNSLWHYIFKTGIYIYKDEYRHQKRRGELTDDILKTYGDDPDGVDMVEERAYQEEEKVRQLRLMQEALERLGEPCNKLLELYYFDERNMVEIAQELHYNNSDTAKNQKYRCIQRLRKIFSKISKNNQ